MAGVNLTATILIRDVDDVDSISERIVVLSKPGWFVKIGRGTMSGDEGLRPAEDNAWFDSRVMSRHHAILRADPITREFTIEDTGSMHGTQCNGKRLKTKEPQVIFNRDVLVFGADVTRGSSQFRALKVMVGPSWSDEEGPDPTFSLLPSFRNTFSADYSEEDMYDDAADQDHIYDEELATTAGVQDETKDDHPKETSPTKSYGEHGNWADYSEDEPLDEPDDEVEIIKESVRAPSIEVVIPQRDASVMVSEDSDQASSYFSEGEVGESPTSSPLGLNDDRADNPTRDTSTKVFNARVVNLDPERATGDDPEPYPHSDRSRYTELAPEARYVNPDEAEDMRTNLDCQSMPGSSRGPIYDPGSTSSNKPFPQLHPLDATRAPSPSEVAMVKPISDVIIQPPFLQQVPAYRDPLPSYPLDILGRDPAWDGPNWDFYAPAHQHVVVSENPCVRDTEYIPFEPQYMVNPTPLDTPFASTSTMASSLANAPPLLPVHEAKSTPKCSIAQLLDQSKNNEEQVRNDSSKSLKRKADQMCSSTEEKQPFETHDFLTRHNDLESGPHGENSNTVYHGTERKPNVTSTVHTDIAANQTPEKVSEETETRPRKRVKKEQSSNNEGGSFMKMAAATLAGVAIGTVGTIIGLASLPQDYFL